MWHDLSIPVESLRIAMTTAELSAHAKAALDEEVRGMLQQYYYPTIRHGDWVVLDPISPPKCPDEQLELFEEVQDEPVR